MKIQRDNVADTRRRGSMLVEALFTVLILALLMGAIGMSVQRGSGTYGQGVATAEVEAQARRMVERIAREFPDAARSTLQVTPPDPLAGRSVAYERVQGWNAGGLLTGPRRQVRIALMPGELDNGVDDNSNGLVDECRIEFQPDVVGDPGLVIGWGSFVREYLEGETLNGVDDNGNGLVDERGLCLTYDNASGVLTVRLTLERLDPLGRPLTRTVETAVQVRNN